MLSIREVCTKKDLREFVNFPDRLYKDCPQYVPALHSDQKKSLTASPSLLYCKRKMWLAVDSAKVVGRICAIINPRYNSLYNLRRVRFGWFDTIEDIAVARLLIQTASDWASSEGMTEIHGPLYYNTLGKQGMLVEGFGNTPPFNCLYNYPYYNVFMEQLGFEKECDWVQYRMAADQGIPEKTRRVARLVKERYNLHIGSLDSLKKNPEFVKKFFHIYSDSFSSSVYNFIPFTEEEIEEEARMAMPFISDRASTVLLDANDNPVAFGISFPSISEALKKAGGRLFPFGWIHLLRAKSDYRITDLMINGVVPEWQNRGVSSVYYEDMAGKAKRIGNRWAISNPQIESNGAVNIWNSYECELFMRRRCYLKKI